LAAVVLGSATFGIATAVQASIPDSNAIVHSCYNTSLAHGNPIGAMRAIDTSTPSGNCAPWEGAVDLATPQYVQNVVTSTINQTSFMVSGSGTLFPSEWVGNYFCPAGYVVTDLSLGANDGSFGSNDTLTTHSSYNDGEVASGVPGATGHYFFLTTGSPTVTIHATCVNGRVFGQAGPAVPIGTAEKQAKITLSPKQ
jgi:hypothetical protein